MPASAPDRADLVLAGCAILEAHPPRVSRAERLRIADRGLREGILVELMQRGPASGASRDRAMTETKAPGARGRPRAEDAGQDRAQAHALLDALAAAPAQRSLCRARQARGLSLARGLQADRRSTSSYHLLKPGAAHRRSRRRAGRLVAGRGGTQSAPSGQGQDHRHRPARHRADAGVEFTVMDFLDADAPRPAEGHARRQGRRRAFRHGGQCHRPRRPITCGSSASSKLPRISPARC